MDSNKKTRLNDGKLLLMKSSICAGIFWLWLSLTTAFQASAATVADYTLYKGFGKKVDNHHTCLILRKFLLDNALHYLAVDPESLAAFITPASGLAIADTSWKKIGKRFASSSYNKDIQKALASDTSMQDAGISHFFPARHGIDLTIDLCPSRHPFNRSFFDSLLVQFSREEKPVPVAISITGAWMQEHPDDFAWLVSLDEKNELDITWINHTYHHHVAKDMPLTMNFLLEKGTNLNDEILLIEKALIEKGQTPSIFFRFPGLVSDSMVFVKVIDYGLIPVGSDAWLAKNQRPKDGSIVLVHANGNDPIGIERFFKLMKEKRDSIMTGHWMLFDLRESLAENEK